MHISRHDTAVILIDPQREGSRENGVHERRTVENMERILKAARRNGFKVFVSPHYFYVTDDGWKFHGPRATVEHEAGMFNDLVLRLRKHGISRIILGGMLANMCVESHLRDLLEQGFEVVVATDATAGPGHPDCDEGYTAALINFAFLAHAVRSTDDLVNAMARPDGLQVAGQEGALPASPNEVCREGGERGQGGR